MIRLALAIAIAATADLVVLLRVDDWVGVAALFAIAYLALASAGAGFFSGRRSALAGALAVIVGVLLSGVAQYAIRASYDNDIGVLIGFELQLIGAFAPYAIVGAIAGALGGALRRGVARRAR